MAPGFLSGQLGNLARAEFALGSTAALPSRASGPARASGMARPSESLDDLVWTLIERTFRAGHLPEKRRSKRFAFGESLVITPLSEEGDEPAGPTAPASGRHISVTGLGFHHTERITARRVAVTFNAGTADEVSLLLDLRYCRFIRDGWYESGGRFLGRAPQPGAR